MNRYVALLRGINVGGHNRIGMAELKAGFEGLGFQNVVTYMQSGNVVFGSEGDESPELTEKIQSMIKQHFGHDVTVIVKSSEEMNRVVAENPFLTRLNIDQTKLHATFLSELPQPELLATIDAKLGGEDEWQAIGASIYLYCPNGYGRSKLTNGLFERTLKLAATTRNWKSVMALVDLGNQKN